jgi:benzodiazapine receptor
MPKRRSTFTLLAFGATVAAAGWLASRFSPRDLRTQLWYRRLRKPPYNPPQIAFPIVWTALYALIAVSGARIWDSPPSAERTRALRLWSVQLATNVKWTWHFFGQHRPRLALLDVLILEAFISSYIAAARKVDTPAAVCFYPYAAWIAFAAVLNADIALRNPRAHRLLPAPANPHRRSDPLN